MMQILLTSSILIAVVLVLRLLLRKRISKRLLYATWLLVALRLLIPLQFGHSQYSVAALEQQSTPIQQVQESLEHPLSGPSYEELYQQLVANYQAQNQTAVTPEVRIQLQQEAQAQITAPTLEQVLKIIWLVGCGFMACWFLAANLLFLHRARKGAVAYTQVSAPIRIRISSNVSTPCLAGLFRPVIYLTPDSVTDIHKQTHILTHELTHLKHWDHLWAWVRCLCLCIYWFNPLVWIAAMASKRDCELACDEAALKKLGDDQRIAYGKTLLDTVTHSPAHIFQTATAMSESKKQLKERVSFIVKKPKHFWVAAIALIVVTTLTAGLVFAGCTQSPPDPTDPIVNPSQNVTTAPPSTTPPTSETTAPTNTEPTPEPDSDSEPLPETDPAVLAIAEDAVYRFMWYWATDVCCDLEPVFVEDMSQYLTGKQKKIYHNQQHRITCCDTVEEVVNHMNQVLGKDLQRADPAEKVFSDGESLYVIILPTEYRSFTNVRVVNYSDTYIDATAENRDEDGIYAIAQFHIELSEHGARITDVQFTDVPPCNHDYEVTTIPPYDTEGYDLHTCKKCGYWYKDNFTEQVLYID